MVSYCIGHLAPSVRAYIDDLLVGTHPSKVSKGVRVSFWTVVPSMERPYLNIVSWSGNCSDAWLTTIPK